MKKYWLKLKEYPLLYNAVLIVVSLSALALAATAVMHVGTRHGSHRTVPDFTGTRLAEAQREAGRSGLEIIVNDSLFVPVYEGGIILDQLPDGGTEVKAGRKVYVTINSYRQKMVRVPYVAGRSLRQAKNMLETAGLEIAELRYVDDIATNYVLGEFCDGVEILPESTMEAEMGSGITLNVGVQGGYGLAAAPKLIGLSLARAKSRIWEMGLNVGRITYDADVDLLSRKDARVYSQSVRQGHNAVLGTAVDLKLTLDFEKAERLGAASDEEARALLEARVAREREEDSLRLAEPAEENALRNGDASSAGAGGVSQDDDFFQ